MGTERTVTGTAEEDAGARGAPPREAGGARRRQNATLAALVLVVLSYGLMQTMLVPTVGVLQRELGASAAAASWAVLSSTLLSSAVVTPLVGRLADRHGTRGALLASLAVYLLGTAGAVFAPDVAWLIGFRAVQGVSLALLPLAFTVVRQVLPPGRVAFGLALTSGLVGGTAGVGLLAGGLVVDHASWRWLFVAGSVLVLAALVACARWVPEVPAAGRGRIDTPGALVLAAALVALLLAVTEGPAWGWGSPAVLALFGAAPLLFAAFVLVERRVADPLVDLGLLTGRRLAAAHTGAFLLGLNQFVFYVLLPRLSQLPDRPAVSGHAVARGFGTTVTGAALILLPGTLLSLAASGAAPRLERRRGARFPLAGGLAVAAAGGVLLAVAHTAVWEVVVGYAVCGTGYGFAMAALPRLVASAAPAAHGGAANGVNTVARTVGGAVGSQVGISLVVGVTAADTGLASPAAYTVAFAGAAAVAAAGALGAARGPRP
ncbi:MFS transporter [Streptomyces sp. NPDC050560]|uniref:MFS transporter n=1 Tax=Streptomyces sp. NPDC050560 TaxID=3365630 RepID=UPI0037B8FB35